MQRIFFGFLFLVLLANCERKGDMLPVQNPEPAPVAIAPVTPIEETLPDNSALGPMESIKKLDQEIEEYELGDNLTEEQKRNNNILKARIVRGTFDIHELCRLALAKHWETITADEQNTVVLLMTRLLEKKALFSKERLTGKDKYYNIQYLSEDIDKTDPSQALVKTKLHVQKRDLHISIHYKLIKTPKGWKIFDVIVDDSSMLLNYRSAFNNIITKYGFPELVNRMQNKLEEIK